MKKGECLIDGWDEAKIKEILDKQQKKVRAAKKQGHTTIEGICIVCDDSADNSRSMNSQVLTSMFTRQRHNLASIILMSQRYRLMHPNNRVNATALFVFRLRNNKDLLAILEENSALATQGTLHEVYDIATREEYQFLYIDLTKSDPNLAFFKGFKSRLQVE